MICGDSLYKVESTGKYKAEKKVGGISVPSTTYGSTKARDIYQNLKTIIIEGEKTQVNDSVFRYAITLKLIGDQSEEWRIWLYNSCTKEGSYVLFRTSDGARGWADSGALSNQLYFGEHKAFQLECDATGIGCRYNQACLTFLPSGTIAAGEGDGQALSLAAADSYCVNLIYGEGFDGAATC
jgi:hypothetical protein